MILAAITALHIVAILEAVAIVVLVLALVWFVDLAWDAMIEVQRGRALADSLSEITRIGLRARRQLRDRSER